MTHNELQSVGDPGEQTPPDPTVAVMDCMHPEAVISLVLHYSQLRSQYRLAQSFWEQFPTEADWQAFLCSAEFLHGVDEFAQVLKDMRDAMALGGLMTPEDVQQIGGQNHDRAMYAVEELAQLLEIPGEEIISASL